MVVVESEGVFAGKAEDFFLVLEEQAGSLGFGVVSEPAGGQSEVLGVVEEVVGQVFHCFRGQVLRKEDISF